MKQECQSCGTINPNLNGFCVHCGNTLRVTTPTGQLLTSQPTPGFAMMVAAPKGNRGLIFALVGMVATLVVTLGAVVLIVVVSGAGSKTTGANAVLAVAGTISPALQTTPQPTSGTPGQLENASSRSEITAENKLSINNLTVSVLTATPLPPTTTNPTNTPVLTNTIGPTVTATATASPIPVSTPQAISNANKIAFAQPDDTNHWDIYTINFDGTGLNKLIHRDQDVIAPAFSPNGQQIVYVLDYESNRRQLRIVNADGSGDRELTSASYKNEYPVWVNDQTILYTSDRNYGQGTGKTDIYQLDVRTGNEFVAVTLGGFPSRSGGLTTFSRFSGTYIEVFGMDGGGLKLLAGHNSDYDFGMVSPDGQLIAVSRNYAQLFLLDRNGNQEQLTPSSQIAKNPVWSPDGSYIAYLIRGVNNNIWEINVIDVNTKQIRRLYTNGKLKSYLAWGR